MASRCASVQARRHELLHRPRRIQRAERPVPRPEEPAGDLDDPLQDGDQRALRGSGPCRPRPTPRAARGRDPPPAPVPGEMPWPRSSVSDSRRVRTGPGLPPPRRNPGRYRRPSARPHTSRSTSSRPMTCVAPMPAEDVPLGHVLGIRLRAVVAPRLETLDQGVVDLERIRLPPRPARGASRTHAAPSPTPRCVGWLLAPPAGGARSSKPPPRARPQAAAPAHRRAHWSLGFRGRGIDSPTGRRLGDVGNLTIGCSCDIPTDRAELPSARLRHSVRKGRATVSAGQSASGPASMQTRVPGSQHSRRR